MRFLRQLATPFIQQLGRFKKQCTSSVLVLLFVLALGRPYDERATAGVSTYVAATVEQSAVIPLSSLCRPTVYPIEITTSGKKNIKLVCTYHVLLKYWPKPILSCLPLFRVINTVNSNKSDAAVNSAVMSILFYTKWLYSLYAFCSLPSPKFSMVLQTTV